MTSPPSFLPRLLSDRIGGPLGLDAAPALPAAALAYLDTVRAGEPQGAAGRVAFFDLPYPGRPVQPPDVLARVCRWGTDLRDAGIRRVVWIGLGGSVLGPRMLDRALDPGPEALPVTFVDSLDPEAFARLLAETPLTETRFVLVSKSGGTAETIALGSWVLAAVTDAGLSPAAHLTVVTGTSGPLAELADAFALERFPVPDGVGGRWSVLSAVGLLVAAARGAAPEALLVGARAVDQLSLASAVSGPHQHAAWLAAALERGRTTWPFLVYSERLALVGDWVQQLWMESLGKRLDLDGRTVRQGLTVVAARGPSDQHSMLQEWIDGPPEAKLTQFIVADSATAGPPLAGPLGGNERLGPLVGRTPRQIQVALYRGTADAMQAEGVPSMTLHVPAGPQALGALIQWLELVTALVAAARRLNAYDQPGVESGKVIARTLLGRMSAGALPDDPELRALLPED